jgi:hypothetical protein
MEDKEQNKDTKQERFNSFMFGPGRDTHQSNQHQDTTTNPTSIDYGELMVNIDTLMESLQGFKPLFQKAYPLIEQFWKKK